MTSKREHGHAENVLHQPQLLAIDQKERTYPPSSSSPADGLAVQKKPYEHPANTTRASNMPSGFPEEFSPQPSALLPAAGVEQSLRQPWKEWLLTEVAARLKAEEDEVGRQNQERLKEAYKATGPTIQVIATGTG